MNQGKFVFSQFVTFIPSRVFDRCASRYHGNKWIKHFSCWNQLLCMLFGQLSGRDSLRDLLTCLGAHTSKFYHLGFGSGFSRTTVSRANEKRDWRIFHDFAMEMIALARQRCVRRSDILKDIEGTVYAFDATTIDLCLSVFTWATFRRAKGGIKLHTLFDVRTTMPAFVYVTPASVNDVRGIDAITAEPGAYYLLDRAYIDFERLYRIDSAKAFFVTRAKSNTQVRRMSSADVDRRTGVISDQTVRFTGPKTSLRYPVPIRKVRFRDREQERTFVFLTNNFTLPPETIALLYKHRWSIELFFKWIKQHLQIDAFWGKSENAVKTQVYIAIAAYAIVAIMKDEMKLTRSMYEILQIIGVSLLDKTPLRELLAPEKTHDDLSKTQLALDFLRN